MEREESVSEVAVGAYLKGPYEFLIGKVNEIREAHPEVEGLDEIERAAGSLFRLGCFMDDEMRKSSD